MWKLSLVKNALSTQGVFRTLSDILEHDEPFYEDSERLKWLVIRKKKASS